MNKSIISVAFVLLMSGFFCMSTTQASDQASAGSTVDVAVASPSNTQISAKNLPTYLDEGLASKHADFSSFAQTKIRSLNRNHNLSKSRMQIVKQPDGSYLARYHAIDNDSLICKVRRSKSKSIPYVGVLRYKERIMESAGITPEACRSGEFIPVAIIPNRHIFSYKKGSWR